MFILVRVQDSRTVLNIMMIVSTLLYISLMMLTLPNNNEGKIKTRQFKSIDSALKSRMSSEVQESAATELIGRILPQNLTKRFIVSVKKFSDSDFGIIEAKNDYVYINASSGKIHFIHFLFFESQLSDIKYKSSHAYPKEYVSKLYNIYIDYILILKVNHIKILIFQSASKGFQKGLIFYILIECNYVEGKNLERFGCARILQGC